MDFGKYEMVLVGIGEEFQDNADALEAYNKLAEKLKGKNYFIISLCMDDVIFESNLLKDRIVTVMGGKRKKQCPDACDNKLYDPGEKCCPVCGKELVFNNILAEKYIEDDYIPVWEKYKKWLTGTLNKSVLALELGVSLKFPQIIRWPYEKIVFLNEKAFLLRVNEKIPQISADISGKGEAVKLNSVKWLIEN